MPVPIEVESSFTQATAIKGRTTAASNVPNQIRILALNKTDHEAINKPKKGGLQGLPPHTHYAPLIPPLSQYCGRRAQIQGYSSATVQSVQCRTKANVIGDAQGSNRQLIATSSLHAPVDPQRAQTTKVKVEVHRPKPNGSKTSMCQRQLMPRARPHLTTSTPPTCLIQPRQSLAPPRVSAVRQVQQHGPHHVDHKHAEPRILSLTSQRAALRIARRSSTNRLQRHKKILQAAMDTNKCMMPELKNAHPKIQTMDGDDSQSQEEDMDDMEQHQGSNTHNASQRISNSNLDGNHSDQASGWYVDDQPAQTDRRARFRSLFKN